MFVLYWRDKPSGELLTCDAVRITLVDGVMHILHPGLGGGDLDLTQVDILHIVDKELQISPEDLK